MVRRKLDEGLSGAFKSLVENYNIKEWDITNVENTRFYNYIFEDVKSAQKIYIPYTLTGNGLEFFDEVLFEDGSTHYFWNNCGEVGKNLLVEEMRFSDEALKEKIYCDEI